MQYSRLSALFLGSFCSALPSVQEADVAQLALTHRLTSEAHGPKVPGAVALAKAYAKYDASVPTAVKMAAEATQTGSDSGSTVLPFDQAYLFPITVGSDKMMVEFDTGSSDFWVFSTEVEEEHRGNHSLYHPRRSGKKYKGESWVVLYVGFQGAFGDVWNDTLTIGDLAPFEQEVEAAQVVTFQFRDGYPDGIMGFAFGAGNKCINKNYAGARCATPFENLQPSLPSPIFTATLRNHKPGEFDFGFLDHSKYTGSIVNAPLSKRTQQNIGPGAWKFDISGYSIGDSVRTKASLLAVPDTGSPFVFTEENIVDEYYQNVQGAHFNDTLGAWIYPCKNSGSLEAFSLYIGGQKRTTPGSFIHFGPADNDGNCYGGLQVNTGLNFTLVGDPFLKSQYVVFNTVEKTMGFAQQAGVKV